MSASEALHMANFENFAFKSKPLIIYSHLLYSRTKIKGFAISFETYSIALENSLDRLVDAKPIENILGGLLKLLLSAQILDQIWYIYWV